MTKNLFIATTEPYSGKSLVALGIVNMLLGKARKVGYFKPIINYDPKEKKDPHIDTIIQHFNLPIAYNDAYAFTRRQVMRQLEGENRGEEDPEGLASRQLSKQAMLLSVDRVLERDRHGSVLPLATVRRPRWRR